MKRKIIKNKEYLHLSFIVIISISFSLFVFINKHLLEIAKQKNVYPDILQFVSYDSYIFAIAIAIIIIILYKLKIITSANKELESIISSINHSTLLITDRDNKIIKVNRSIEELTGNSPEEILGRKLNDIIDITHRKKLNKILSGDLGGKSVIDSLKYKRKNGDMLFLEVIVERISSGTGNVILLKDVTERIENEKNLKKLNSKLNKLITVDIFTGVLNRRGLEERLAREYRRAKRQGFSVLTMAACLVEINNFKRTKQQLGSAASNVVLKEIGKRLARSLRSTDIVARISEDRFMAILPDCGLTKAMEVAERMRLAVASCSMPECQQSFNMTASIGVSPLPSSFTSVEEIITLIRVPLKRSKTLGENRVSLAGNPMYKYDRSREIRNTVVDTLLKGECFYQLACPIMRLENMEVVGNELLSRCTIADLTTPDIFFGFAHENNILTSVDIKCFHACMDAISSSISGTVWHINVFPSTLMNGSGENLLKLLRIPQTTNNLCLEFSEQKLVGAPENLKDVTKILKEAGILIAIDNLGVGRDSLATLQAIEPDMVKIDRLYVEGIANDSIKRKAFQRMFETLSSHEVHCIVDGIENQLDLRVLKSMGVEYGQGGYLGKTIQLK